MTFGFAASSETLNFGMSFWAWSWRAAWWPRAFCFAAELDGSLEISLAIEAFSFGQDGSARILAVDRPLFLYGFRG